MIFVEHCQRVERVYSYQRATIAIRSHSHFRRMFRRRSKVKWATYAIRLRQLWNDRGSLTTSHARRSLSSALLTSTWNQRSLGLISPLTYLLGCRRGVAVERRTCDQEVVGSSLGRAPRRKNSGQVSHTYVPLSPSSITWYWPKGGDARRLGR